MSLLVFFLVVVPPITILAAWCMWLQMRMREITRWLNALESKLSYDVERVERKRIEEVK